MGQHFLSRHSAARLVQLAHIHPTDLVVEIGAGRGAITTALASSVRKVIAVEIDPRLAHGLRNKFARSEVVQVVEADILSVSLPPRAFRVIGNVPFAITTPLFRQLFDDPSSPLERADLIVQKEVARKRTANPPRNLLTLTWVPWWSFETAAFVPARLFHPNPGASAAGS